MNQAELSGLFDSLIAAEKKLGEAKTLAILARNGVRESERSRSEVEERVLRSMPEDFELAEGTIYVHRGWIIEILDGEGDYVFRVVKSADATALTRKIGEG
jgi:hypothetical protein